MSIGNSSGPFLNSSSVCVKEVCCFLWLLEKRLSREEFTAQLRTTALKWQRSEAFRWGSVSEQFQARSVWTSCLESGSWKLWSKQSSKERTVDTYRRLAKGRSWKERRGISSVLFSAVACLTFNPEFCPCQLWIRQQSVLTQLSPHHLSVK